MLKSFSRDKKIDRCAGEWVNVFGSGGCWPVIAGAGAGAGGYCDLQS